MESKHKGVRVFKCLMCAEVLNSKETFKQHKIKHQKELDVVTFEHVCKECNISFGCREYQIQHLLDKHRPRNYVPKSVHDTHPEECKNGKSCKWLKNGRCRYEDNEQPWKTVQPRRPRQLVTQQSLKKQPSQHQKQEVMQQGKKHQQIRQQQQVRQQQSRQSPEKQECLNGTTCKYFKEDRCNFYHKHHNNQPNSARHQSGGPTQLRQCKFGARCDKGRNCGFLHLPKDFLPLQGGRQN